MDGKAQVDTLRAQSYFKEAAALCESEGGRLWGISLCGPMVFADAATKTIATNQPAPQDKQPAMLGFVNAPLKWGESRWAAYVWSMIPSDDEQARGRLMLHELFHRVQPQLGLLVTGQPNEHLDTLEGRYWMQMEWRALARALAASGPERLQAISHALAFRATRRALFEGVAESERVDEIREGLAQYTGTVAAAESSQQAVVSAIEQLKEAPAKPTFVITFAYPSGAAYGVLLDASSPGWTRRIKPRDDLGRLLQQAAQVQTAHDAQAAAPIYQGAELRAAEEKRQADRLAKIAELRRRFVEGPVLVAPRAGEAMLNTTGVTPIPGHGSVYFEYRLTAKWGSLESSGGILLSSDGDTLGLAMPFQAEGNTLTGEGWKITLAPGWGVQPGSREGDFQVVRQED